MQFDLAQSCTYAPSMFHSRSTPGVFSAFRSASIESTAVRMTGNTLGTGSMSTTEPRVQGISAVHMYIRNTWNCSEYERQYSTNSKFRRVHALWALLNPDMVPVSAVPAVFAPRINLLQIQFQPFKRSYSLLTFFNLCHRPISFIRIKHRKRANDILCKTEYS